MLEEDEGEEKNPSHFTDVLLCIDGLKWLKTEVKPRLNSSCWISSCL